MALRSRIGIGAAMVLSAQMLASVAHAAMFDGHDALVGFAVPAPLVTTSESGDADTWTPIASLASAEGGIATPIAHYGGLNGALMDEVRLGLQGTGETSPVPLPGTLWLMGSALAGFIYLQRRRTLPFRSVTVGDLP